MICGHVDSGKSTTTGRLIFELGGLPERELEKLKAGDSKWASEFGPRKGGGRTAILGNQDGGLFLPSPLLFFTCNMRKLVPVGTRFFGKASGVVLAGKGS